MENADTPDASIVETIDEQAGQIAGILPDIGIAVLVVILFLAIGWLIGFGLRATLLRHGDRIHASFVARLPIWVFGFIGVLIATDYLGAENLAAGLLAGGGATAIILGFAFREVGENFLAGIFLVFSRPFRVGDLIQSGDLPEGLVRAVDLRNTHIRSGDGRDIYIPNAHIFNTPLVNYTRDGLRRPTFTVGVDYRDPLDAVRAAILDAVSAVDGVLEAPPPQVNIAEFAAAYAVLEVWVWINTFDGSDFAAVKSAAMEATRCAILDNGWTISADTRTAIDLYRQANDA